MREEILAWWKQSREDFESAKYNLKGGRYYLAIFLCQQSVEKGLKACFMKIKKSNPGNTHSLLFLAREVSLPTKFYGFLRRLTPQFVNTRYPDAASGTPSEIYDEESAALFLKETEEVMEWLDSVMNK